MKEALSIETERVDDIPLLISHMQRMKLSELLDKHFPIHGHRKGLSLGNVGMVWLAHILSQTDHRMNRVQEWTTRRLETLRGSGVNSLEARDLTDDRLADILRSLGCDVHWQAFDPSSVKSGDRFSSNLHTHQQKWLLEGLDLPLFWLFLLPVKECIQCSCFPSLTLCILRERSRHESLLR